MLRNCQLFIFLSFALFFFAAQTHGADFNVTTVTDFQNALTAAQSNGADDVIYVAAGTYDVSGATLTYLAAENEDNDLTIEGAGSGVTILDGGNTMQIMDISSYNGFFDDYNTAIAIRGITFRKGNGGSTGGLELQTYAGDILVERNEFLLNSAAYGGGLRTTASFNGETVIMHNVFSSNSASFLGGGAYLTGVNNTITVSNNVFSLNSAPSGGGVYVETFTDAAIITNNTVYNNYIHEKGALYVWLWDDQASADIRNNILWGNLFVVTPGLGHDIYLEDDVDGNGTGQTINFTHNDYSDFYSECQNNSGCVPALTLSANAIQDPLLTPDLYLEDGSPCIDAGDTSAPGMAPEDSDGNQRILGSAVDMGAYEMGSCPVFFSDVQQGHWALGYITALACSSIANGYPDGTYQPAQEVTRAQMAVYLVRAIEGDPAPNYCAGAYPFSDVPPGHWACSHIKRLQELTISTGYPDGTFRPGLEVNRAEMAVFLIRGKEGDPQTGYCGDTDPYSDIPSTHWACGHIKRLSELTISTGYPDGTYRPSLKVNRAQMAVFVSRTFPGLN